ncbi:hypothetical protein ACFB49_42430 [Sphingomonas sp. DBB INV C78]|uniref:hypothetical protein n=1 Tax=Sphingomonas sp. DBB INV C78 TaxID=3349434 RepID=UPI0036D37D14
MNRQHILAAAIAFTAMCLLALSACQPPRGSDGYSFEQAEWSNSNLRVTLVLHPTLGDLEREGKAAGALVHREEDIQAWSLIDAHGNCTVHIVDPAKRYMPEFAGHELTHCAFGRFHGARLR